MGKVYKGEQPASIYICGHLPDRVSTNMNPVCKYQYWSTFEKYVSLNFMSPFANYRTTQCLACKGECERDYNLEKARRSKCPFIAGQPMCMMEKCMSFDEVHKICKKCC